MSHMMLQYELCAPALGHACTAFAAFQYRDVGSSCSECIYLALTGSFCGSCTLKRAQFLCMQGYRGDCLPAQRPGSHAFTTLRSSAYMADLQEQACLVVRMHPT